MLTPWAASLVMSRVDVTMPLPTAALPKCHPHDIPPLTPPNIYSILYSECAGDRPLQGSPLRLFFAQFSPGATNMKLRPCGSPKSLAAQIRPLAVLAELSDTKRLFSATRSLPLQLQNSSLVAAPAPNRICKGNAGLSRSIAQIRPSYSERTTTREIRVFPDTKTSFPDTISLVVQLRNNCSASSPQLRIPQHRLEYPVLPRRLPYAPFHILSPFVS